MSTKYIALVAAAVALASTSTTEAAGLRNHHNVPHRLSPQEEAEWDAHANLHGTIGQPPQYDIGVSVKFDEEQGLKKPMRATHQKMVRPVPASRRLTPQEEAEWDAHANIHGTIGQPPQYDVGVSVKWDEEEQALRKPTRVTKKVRPQQQQQPKRKIEALEDPFAPFPTIPHTRWTRSGVSVSEDPYAPFPTIPHTRWTRSGVSVSEDPYAPFPTIPHTTWTRSGVSTSEEGFMPPPPSSRGWGSFEEGLFDIPVNDRPSPNWSSFEDCIQPPPPGYRGVWSSLEEGIQPPPPGYRGVWSSLEEGFFDGPVNDFPSPNWSTFDEDGVASQPVRKVTHKPRGQTKFTQRPQRK